MRRLALASVCVTVLGLVGAGTVVGTAAGATSDAQPRIICPLATTPCCGPPVQPPTLCCTPPAAGAEVVALCQALSITTTPSSATAGDLVTIAGRLGAGTAGVTVTLWQRLPGQTGYRAVAHTMTALAGAYKFRRRVETNRSWYVAAGTLKSLTVTEPVSARVGLSVRGANLLVAVRPSRAGERVVMQRKRGKAWRSAASGRLHAGRATFALGRGTWRAELVGNRWNATSFSRAVHAAR